MSYKWKPKIGVFKFASCDGCQLSLLDAEDELLGVTGAVEISYFPEASRAMAEYFASSSPAIQSTGIFISVRRFHRSA